MANTTNFNWETPDDTDLVKDGAAAIRTLGNSIDTSFVDLKGGTTGQVLSKASNTDLDYSWTTFSSGGLTLIARTSFSNVASQTFDSVFSSTYKSYLVMIENIYAATATDDLQLQLRYSTTTLTSGYYGTSYGYTYAGTNQDINVNNASSFTISNNIGSSSYGGSGFFYIAGVGQASSMPRFNGQFINGNNPDNYWFGGQHFTLQTYTGFVLKSSSTNVTGTVAIYGLAAQ